MAIDFPLASFIGMDISSVISQETKPQNVKFIQGNILDGLPFQDNSVDYIHQRYLAAAIPYDKWPSLINDMVRALKPGGYLEVF